MRVAILPYELRSERDLSAISLGQLDWPGQAVPQQGTVASLTAQDHLVVYPSSVRLLHGLGAVSCQVSLLLAEPLAIQRRYYRSLWLLRHKFKYILCRYGYYAGKYANVLQLPVVEAWVNADLIQIPQLKSSFCSLIASAKQNLAGHKLRHQMVAQVNAFGLDVAVLGRGYQPFENKQDGLLNYRYSVVIENVREPDYFTEKLLDCMLCGALPIYWGAPNIGDYFDVSGMVLCENAADIEQAMADNNQKPSWLQTEAMERNREIAISLSQLQPRIVLAIQHKEVTQK